MGFVIEAVATYAAYIYAVCGLVALYHIYKVWLVRSERRQAVFSLEREKAMRELFGVFYVALILLTLMGFTYFISTTLADAVAPLVQASRDPQPELPFIPTPTTTPLPETPTAEAIDLPTSTPNPDGTQSAENTPTAPPAANTATDEVEATQEAPPTDTPAPPPPEVAAAPACADPRAIITSPGNGQSVSGIVPIMGSAAHEAFQFYKIEVAPGANAEGGFVYQGGGSAPVQNGQLIAWDTNALGAGAWTVRLIVVDQTGNFPPPCTVTVTIGG